jgi:hypothetical protein
MAKEPTLEEQLKTVQGQLDQATQKLNQFQLGGFGIEDALKTALSQRSAEFQLPREALEARFGTKESPLYVDNPFVRRAIIERSLSQKQENFNTLASRLQNILGFGAAQQQQLVQGLGARQQGIQETLSARARAQQQDFENQLALQRLAISRSAANRLNAPKPPAPVRQLVNGVFDSRGKQVGLVYIDPTNPTNRTFTNIEGTQSIAPPVGGTIRQLGFQLDPFSNLANTDPSQATQSDFSTLLNNIFPNP